MSESSNASSVLSPGSVRPATLQWGQGAGPKVLLVHGLSSVAASWWRVGTELADAGCTVTAPDLRGHGRSPSGTSYRFVDHAADLATLGTGWDLAIGHSLAGPILATFASGPAESVPCDSLLLLDPVFEIPETTFEVVVAEQLGEIGPNVTVQQLEFANPQWHPEDCFHKAVGAHAASPYVIERCLRDNAPFLHLGLLSDVRVPVRVLRADPAVGTMSPGSALEQVPNPFVSHVQIDGAGHSIQRDRADLVVWEALELLGLT